MVHDRPRIRRRIGLPAALTPIGVPLPEIRELDVAFWFDAKGNEPTCRRDRPAFHATPRQSLGGHRMGPAIVVEPG